MKKPEQFYAEGSKVFRRAPVNREAIRGWVTIAREKVRDSLDTDNSAGTRLSAAYDAVFVLSLAVLSSKGWRVGSADGHHRQALEAACSYASVTSSALDDMDAVRDLRNNLYDGVPLTEDDVKFAHSSLRRLYPVLFEMLKGHL